MAEHKVDFINLDVEGEEYSVVKGGQARIRNEKPIIVFLSKGWMAVIIMAKDRKSSGGYYLMNVDFGSRYCLTDFWGNDRSI